MAEKNTRFVGTVNASKTNTPKMHTRDIPQERREKFALLGEATKNYIMTPSGVIRRRQPKPYANKAERKALKRRARDIRREAEVG